MTDLTAPAPWFVGAGDVVPMRGAIATEAPVAELLRRADVTFVNLETQITDRGAPWDKSDYHRVDASQVATLTDLDVDAVTLANNHMLDYGPLGLDDTLSAIAGAGIAAVGAGNDLAEAAAGAVLPTERGAIGVLGFSASLPPGTGAGVGRPGVAPVRVLQSYSPDPVLLPEQPGMAPYAHTSAVEEDVAVIAAAIAQTRARADLVVVAAHWGIPLGFAAPSYGILAEYQRPLAHRLVDAGADIVIGHHPHYVQPIELYRGSLILYSVGNFVFHKWGLVQGHADAPTRPTERPFPMKTPVPPYINAFGSELTAENVLVRVDPEPGGLVVRLLPTVMDAVGDPHLPDEDRALRILGRLTAPALTDLDGGTTPEIELVPDPDWTTTIGEIHLER